MALDRSRVLETAQKYLAKGQYDKAIAEYQKLVNEDPNDVRTWLKIGDLYTRKGSRRQACDTYGRVARTYAAQGFFLKAVAVYKQILKLDPTRLDIQLALAEMYEHLQLTSDALNTYEQVAAAYARGGDIDKALDTLGKMADLDPENIPVRIKYAEALSKANRTSEAADAFEQGAKLLERQGRWDDYIKVAERLLYHRPEDIPVAKELSRLYLERNDAKRALGKLQLCFKANPRDVETLELLAKAFEVLGQVPKTVSVYKEIARLHQDANRSAERARVLRTILQIDPGDAETREALASYAPSSGAAELSGSLSSPRRTPSIVPPSAVVDSRADIRTGAEAAVAEDELEDDLEVLEPEDADFLEEPELLEEIDEDAEEILIVEEDPTASEEELAARPVTSGARAAASSVPGTPSVPPEVALEAQIARLLTECDVFKRYGLKDKVVDQLRRVLELDPMHMEARERLKDALLEQGRPSDAVEHLYALANALESSSPQLAQLYYTQILEIDPESEPARSLAVDDDQPTTALDEADEDEVLFVDDDEESERTLDEGMRASELPLPPLDGRRADMPPAPDASVEGEVEPEVVQAALAPMSPEEFEAAPLRPSAPGDIEAARVRMSMPPGEVEETLDEVEFFIAQGLYEEARATLQDALGSHPDHPLILEKLEEIADLAVLEATGAAPAPPPPVSTAGESTDDSFLLAEKLAEELGSQDEEAEPGSDVLDVESVFAQFKKGVEEQIGLEDTDTHFDLGIAYKEMGLLDDAIHEFDLARANPQRECISFTMIGLCCVEKGEIADAIAYFKKGLYADTKTDREELGLYFELGQAYELLHDPKEALYYYQKVQKRDPEFRNVGAKIQQLAAPQAAAEPEAPKVEMDDVDRAFDDLMGED